MAVRTQLTTAHKQSNKKLGMDFSSYRIKNIFSFKDPIPASLKSFVVYQFTCAECNSRVTFTELQLQSSRHLLTRNKGHTLTHKNSHVFKHLNNSPNCKSLYISNCFKVLDSSKTSYSLKSKEAFYTNSLKPEVNTKVQYFNTYLS